MTAWNIALLIAGIVVAWLFFWVAVVMLIARLGGWRKLAEAYPPDRAIYDGTRFRMQSAVLRRWVSYNHVITFTVDRQGLLISPLGFFRPGHRPIFLLWSDLDVSYEKRLFAEVAVLRPQRMPAIPITISRKLSEKIAQASGGGWPPAV